MELHLLLNHKKDDGIKGRISCGGDNQRSYTSKKEVSFPTSHIESIFYIAVIDAEKHRDVAVVDTPNAFVQTDLIKKWKHNENHNGDKR